MEMEANMSEDKFEIHRPHKMLDWLEGEVTEWAFGLINLIRETRNLWYRNWGLDT